MPFGICTKASKDDLDKEFRVTVELPNTTNLEVVLSRNSIGLECLEKVGRKLGLTETRYFGLCYKTKNEVEWWLVLEKPVRKQVEQHALDSLNSRNVELKFKVHFFIRDASMIRLQDTLTRHFLYIQLKSHLTEGRLSCDKNSAILLASYAKQAEEGDYDEERQASYETIHALLPLNVSSTCSLDSLVQQIKSIHKSHRGMSTEEAKSEFIRVTQQLDGYGDEYYPAKGKDGCLILLGATFLGVVVKHTDGLPPVYFRWPDIVRISHSKKYFCIESSKIFDMIQFEMEDAPTAKYVWRMFVAHHQFCRLNSSKSKSQPQNDTVNGIESVKSTCGGETTRANTLGSLEAGICNPVFDERDGIAEEHQRDPQLEMAGQMELERSALIRREFPLFDRPASLNLSVKGTQPDEFPLHGGLSTSERSLNHSNSPYENGLLPGAVKSKVGSSLSMDSGNPLGASDLSHGTQSLESLEEKNHQTPAVSGLSFNPQASAGPSRPMSLILEPLADNASEVTGQTSGYSTSSDSDLGESTQLLGDDEQPLTRETQLEELEKILSEGQVFTEFQKLERRSENLATTTAQLEINAERNRFKDVVPYDETRVQLNPRKSLNGGDYINANFVMLDVAQRTYRYIATQGPMENTAADFWQMIWEQAVHIIVAATDEKTNGKNCCFPYWPENALESTKTFGAFRVQTVAVRDYSSYKVRTLSLQHSSSSQKRYVSHLHFTDWPDHGVPSDPVNFLEFLEELEGARQQVSVSVGHAQNVHPIVVHCTAGVGRTGVIILTDLMIACLQSNQPINILKSLISLRRQRMLLVANFGQYRFVYTTLIHFIRNSRLI